MSAGIREADWKLFRKLHPIALQRFCEDTLEDAEEICSDSESPQSAHERYLKLYQLMRERDKEIARLFDDLRRSTAINQLALIYHADLITDEEFEQFSEETQGFVNLHLQFLNASSNRR